MFFPNTRWYPIDTGASRRVAGKSQSVPVQGGDRGMVIGELARLRELFQRIFVHLFFSIGGSKPNVSQRVGRILFYGTSCLANGRIKLAGIVVNFTARGVGGGGNGIPCAGPRGFF